MTVYEVKLKVFLLENIQLEDIHSRITKFIDGAMSKDKELLEIHNRNNFKNYCFDSMYPMEVDKVYKKGNIYTLTIRTINAKLAEFFLKTLVNEYNETMKGLTIEIRILPKKHIAKIYSLTPVIIKNDFGYWKGNLSLEEFERRIKENLIKKYNSINETKIDEDMELYTGIELKNKKPIGTNYKNIKLLGDKISINISDESIAQELAYMSLGTGLGEMNSRGYGFCNYRWL